MPVQTPFHQHVFQVVEVLLRVAGQALVAEAPSAFVCEDRFGGFAGVLRLFERGQALGDERFDSVPVLLVGDLGGGVEDVEVAVSADDFQGGGFGFFVADQLHFVIGAAVEGEHRHNAAGHCGVGGGGEIALAHIDEALFELFEGTPESFGRALVGPGCGGGVLAAAHAPLARFRGGAVGNAVAVQGRQAVPFAGGSIFVDAFTRDLRHVLCPPVAAATALFNR